MIVDKPAGLLTVPTEAREKDTLWSRVLALPPAPLRRPALRGHRPPARQGDLGRRGLRPQPRRALHFLQDALPRARDRARVRRDRRRATPPTTGTFDADLVREPGTAARASRVPGEAGRRAVTRYRTLERLRGERSLVSRRLETGRTHQIRVHFSAAGHPVLGDRVYGARRDARTQAPRQMLHARRSASRIPRRARRVARGVPAARGLRGDARRAPASAKTKRPAHRSAGPPGNRSRRERAN